MFFLICQLKYENIVSLEFYNDLDFYNFIQMQKGCFF